MKKLRENHGGRKKERDKEEVTLDSKKKRVKWAREVAQIVIEQIGTNETSKDIEEDDEDTSTNKINSALKKSKIEKGASRK